VLPAPSARRSRGWPVCPALVPRPSLVHIQNRCRVRRYSRTHETSNLRPFTFGHRRKRAVGNRALRSKDAFVMRRAQIILASERGERASRIARSLGCGSQTVRDAIHDFNEHGLAALEAGSSRPKRTRALPSTRTAPRACGRCSTTLRGSSDTTLLACGHLRWRHG
jgi:hypothetical protein